MALCQDSKGAIWIGTAAGLNRFDGRYMTSLSAGQFGLQGDSVSALAVDNQGKLWVGTLNGGISVLNTAQTSFMAIGKQSLKVRKLVTLGQDVWALTTSGLFKIDNKPVATNDNYVLNPQSLPGANSTKALLTAWQNNLVFSDGLAVWILKSNKWHQLPLSTTDKITSLDGSEQLYIGFGKSGIACVDKNLRTVAQFQVGVSTYFQLQDQAVALKFMDPALASKVGSFRAQSASEYISFVKKQGLPPASFAAILSAARQQHSATVMAVTSSGNQLFVCTPENLYKQDQHGTFRKYQDPTISPSESQVWSFQVAMVSSDKALWIGTNRHGLFKITHLEQGLVTFPFAMNCEKCHRRIYALHVHDSEIWLGLRGTYSLARFNSETGQFAFFGKQDNVACWEVSSISAAGANGVYLGGLLCGVNRFSIPSPFVNKLTLGAEERLNSWILSDEKQPGNLWIGTPDVLFHYQTNGSIHQYASLNKDEYSFYRGVHHNGKQYWINKSYSQLHIFNPFTAAVEVKSLNIPGPKGRRLHSIIALNNQLWLATSQGLWLVDNMGSGPSTQLTLPGSKNYQVKALQPIGNGKVWVTTGNLLALVNGDGKTEMTIGPADGFPLHNITTLALMQDGRLAIGSDEGLSLLNFPQPAVTKPFPVSLAEIKIGYRSLDSTANNQVPSWSANDITLTPDQHSIAIKFNLPGFSTQSSVQYACKLNNIDADWLLLGNHNTMNYDYLSPGVYTFMVKAKVGTGAWSEPTKLIINVTPKFYETSCFRLLMVVVAGGAFWTGLKYRAKAQLAYRHKLEQEVANRTSELKEANQSLQQRAEVIAQQHANLEHNNQVLQQQRLEILAQRDELMQSQQSLVAEYETLSKETSQLKRLIMPDHGLEAGLTEFVDKVIHIIRENITNDTLGPDVLARELGLSRTLLYQRFKQEVGKPVAEFIKEIRLQEGAKLLLQEKLTVTEVAFRVGFSSYAYFTKCFHEYYGKSPTQFIAEMGNG